MIIKDLRSLLFTTVLHQPQRTRDKYNYFNNTIKEEHNKSALLESNECLKMSVFLKKHNVQTLLSLLFYET